MFLSLVKPVRKGRESCSIISCWWTTTRYPLKWCGDHIALETQVFLPSLSKELTGEASLLAEIASNQPEIWKNPDFAQDILTQARPYLAARVMWIAPDGRLLASSDPADADRLGQTLPK